MNSFVSECSEEESWILQALDFVELSDSFVADLLQMRLTWVSGNGDPQEVYYDGGRTSTSTISTFTPSQMCCKFSCDP
jgi:hypothetical protein